jgi:hypothetical protein
MSGGTQESDHESVESIEEQKQNVRKIAKEYTEPIQESYDSDSEGTSILTLTMAISFTLWMWQCLCS